MADGASLPDPIVIEAGPAWARLLSPQLPELSGLLEEKLPPWQLLLALADAGLNLTPGGNGGGGPIGGGDALSGCGGGGDGDESEGGGGGEGCKDAAVERAMCDDVSRVW